MDVKIRAHFDSFVGDPFWPQVGEVIDIKKDSGVDRVRSTAKREQTLKDYLRSHGQTLESFAVLQQMADRPFHTSPDGRILVPHQMLLGAFLEAAGLATGPLRICRPEAIRSHLLSSDWQTQKTVADAVPWIRYVPVKSASGRLLSNQRSRRENLVLHDFDAEGTLHFRGDASQVQRLRDFMRFLGEEVGVGASRKMGHGKFTVVDFAPALDAEEPEEEPEMVVQQPRPMGRGDEPGDGPEEGDDA